MLLAARVGYVQAFFSGATSLSRVIFRQIGWNNTLFACFRQHHCPQ